MFYLVLLAGVMSFLSFVALLDASARGRLARRVAAATPPLDPAAAAVAEIAAAIAGRFGSKHGPLLRVPAQALAGSREDQPCLTPIDCVLGKRCAGHCTCR